MASHLQKHLKEVFKSFDVVVGDEAHLFKAQTLKGILEKMKTTAITYRNYWYT